MQLRDDLIATVVRAVIDAFSAPSLTSTSIPWYFGLSAAECEYLLSRFLEPPSDATSVYDILSPFLPLLTQYLAERNQNLSAEPYRSFVTAVIQTFAEKILVGVKEKGCP
jgi:hypothetical protein